MRIAVSVQSGGEDHRNTDTPGGYACPTLDNRTEEIPADSVDQNRAPSDLTLRPGIPEVCGDAIDQNCDGVVSCVPPCADDTWTPATLPSTIRGSTVGTGNSLTSTCGGSGPELAYWFTPPVSGTLVFDSQGSTYDTLMFAYDACGGASLGCNDDFYGLRSRLEIRNLTAGVPILVVIDGYGGSSGNFTLNVHR